MPEICHLDTCFYLALLREVKLVRTPQLPACCLLAFTLTVNLPADVSQSQQKLLKGVRLSPCCETLTGRREPESAVAQGLHPASSARASLRARAVVRELVGSSLQQGFP